MQTPTLITAMCLVTTHPAVDRTSSGIDIGDRIQPMVDRHLVESMNGVELRLASPRDEGPVLAFDRSWEGRFSGYSRSSRTAMATSSTTVACRRPARMERSVK